MHTRIAQSVGGEGCHEVADWVASYIQNTDGIDGLRVRIGELPSQGLTVGQVNLVHGGRRMRVQAAATRPRHAGVLLIERTARQLHHSGRGFRPRPWPDPMAGPHPAGHGGPHRITRRKQVRLKTLTAQQALAELDALDQQAHLFTDTETGMDAVVYRGGPHGYRLARTGSAEPPATAGTPLVTNPRPTPQLTEPEALARISIGTDPFAFYSDPNGRGALLYARYHGGYGLITAH